MLTHYSLSHSFSLALSFIQHNSLLNCMDFQLNELKYPLDVRASEVIYTLSNVYLVHPVNFIWTPAAVARCGCGSCGPLLLLLTVIVMSNIQYICWISKKSSKSVGIFIQYVAFPLPVLVCLEAFTEFVRMYVFIYAHKMWWICNFRFFFFLTGVTYLLLYLIWLIWLRKLRFCLRGSVCVTSLALVLKVFQYLDNLLYVIWRNNRSTFPHTHLLW